MTPASAPAGDTFKVVHAEIVPLGNGASLAFSPMSGRPFIVPESVAQLLALCDSFRSLDDHARRLARPLALDANGRRELRTSLDWLARNGFLASGRELLALLCGPRGDSRARGPQRIDAIGIPTADRPQLLERLLRSYVVNLESHGRDALFIVVDDSRSPTNAAANRGVVEALVRGGRRALYVGLEHRRRLARHLAAQTGIERACVEFALAPNPRFGRTTGGARNTLLLLTAGQPFLHVDDDTLARTALVPAPADATRLRVSPRAATHSRFDSWDRLRALVNDEAHVDILAAHERLLGRPLAECLRDPSFTDVRLEEIDHQFLHAATHARSKVRMTCLGAAGDPGTFSSAALLLHLTEESREQLVRSVQGYRAAVVQRKLISAADDYAVLLTPRCFAMNIGLDGSSVLPPFMPVLRGSDGIFGALLHAARACVGILPGAVLHLPRDRRRVLSPVTENPLMHGNAHLLRMLRTMPRPATPSVEATLSLAAGHLRSIASEERTFSEIVGREACVAAAQHVRRLESQLEASARSPAGPLYARHLRHLLRQMQSSMTQGEVRVIDLERAGAAGAAVALRQLVLRFADVMEAWPEISRAARHLEPAAFSAPVQRSRPRRASRR